MKQIQFQKNNVYLFILLIISIVCILSCTQFCEGQTKNEDSWLIQFAKKLPIQNKLNSWRQMKSCKCGLTLNRNYSERIVGGVVSKKNAWPWVGGIVFMNDDTPKIVCGASVINKRYLLTASHCAEYLMVHGIDKFQIILGTNDLNDIEAIVPQLESVIMHPKYNTLTKEYDVALLKLKNPLEFSSGVNPICISPQRGAPYLNKEAIVVGWGTLKFNGVTSTMQMQTMVNVTSNKLCSQKYLKSDEPIKITPEMMCASSPMQDSCQGDSGGAIFLARQGTKSETFEQIGLVSFGSGCADQRYPGVYVRLGKVLNWIKSTTRDSVYCDMT